MRRTSGSFYTVSTETLGDELKIVTFSGELDMTSAMVLEQRLADLVNDSARRAVLDIRAVSFIDSTAIAVVLRAAGRLRQAQRRLVVVCEHPHVLKVLRITGVDAVCPIYSSREEMLVRTGRANAAATSSASANLDVLPPRPVGPAMRPPGGAELNPSAAAPMRAQDGFRS